MGDKIYRYPPLRAFMRNVNFLIKLYQLAPQITKQTKHIRNIQHIQIFICVTPMADSDNPDLHFFYFPLTPTLV